MKDTEDIRLSKFKAAVFEEATRKKDAAVGLADQKKEAALEQAETEILQNSYNTIQKEISEIKFELRRRFSQVKNENKKEMLIARDNLKNKLFDTVKLQLQAYSKTEEYMEAILQRIKELIETQHLTAYTIKINCDNAQFLKQLESILSQDSNLLQDPSILYGGFLIIDKTSHIVLDETYGSALQEEEARFRTYSGMNISCE